VRYGWTGPLLVKGENISLRDYQRFDNPYCTNEFASEKIVISNSKGKLILDFKNGKREL
jgi:hypothetical protein